MATATITKPTEQSRASRRRVAAPVLGDRVFSQLAIITAAFLGYMAVRAIANGSEDVAFNHARNLLDMERTLGFDIEADIQAFVISRGWLIAVFNGIYAWVYWPMIIGTFGFTWLRHRDLYEIYRNALLYSGAVGLVTFALYPVAPPRFLDGFVDTVEGAQRSHFIAHPSFLINNFAALPSFHVGWVALAGAVLALSATRPAVRILAMLPTAAMSVAVVVTGNHYVVDVIAGIAVCLGALTLVHRRASQHNTPNVGKKSQGSTAPLARKIPINSHRSY
jgi:hypothetical protein